MILGASGHASVIIDTLALRNDVSLLGIVDVTLAKGELFAGTPVLGHDNDIEQIIADTGATHFVVALGDNYRRSTLFAGAPTNLTPATIIHPSAQIAPSASIGQGAVIFAGAVVSANAKVGDNCIINHQSSVDHDCQINDHASIAPGAIMGGNCTIGTRTAVGLGANLCHGISIGDDCVIGAGSVVTKPIANLSVAYGSPCKVVRARQLGDGYL